MHKPGTTKKISAVLAVVLIMAMTAASCAKKAEDNSPPTAPLLTISNTANGSVALAWSESYDDEGIDSYVLYRNDEILADVDKIEYIDNDVAAGEYEYYVVAYDLTGNRSAKSVKQKVKISDEPGSESLNQNANLDIQELSKSTVKLYTLDDDLNIIAMGSGTIISKNGYILTNYHCVGDERGLSNTEGYVAIAITGDVKKNIQPQYIAQYRSGVRELDLAVVKIIMDLNWNQVSAEVLNLIPAKMADSDLVKLGDDINILGYPGVGGETITFTAGHVSGFLDDNNDAEIDWIKTDAVVNHGNSGGTAINRTGEMIGIPTAKQVGADNDVMFYLKPVNQALAVVEEAFAQGDFAQIPKPGSSGEAPVQTITVYGQMVDSFTLKAVPGAAFVILKDNAAIEDFAANPQESMIQSYAEADRDGIFACYDVPVGAAYSVIAGADGYYSILEDHALEVPADWEGNMDIGAVYLEKAQ